MKNITLNENAKEEWSKIVKKHKKKQKGLPALSILNTDAGDVEQAIEVFNNSTQTDCSTTDSSVIGESVESDRWNKDLGNFDTKAAAFEAGDKLLAEDISTNKTILVDIDYNNLCFAQQGTKRDADDWDEFNICADWTLQVDKEEIVSFLYEECITEEDLPGLYKHSVEESVSWVNNNFDYLFDKYITEIQEHWEDEAKEDASQHYDSDDYVDWDTLPGGHDYYESIDSSQALDVDDKFDMSLRTIL